MHIIRVVHAVRVVFRTLPLAAALRCCATQRIEPPLLLPRRCT